MEHVITIVIRDADEELVERANKALMRAGFEGWFSQLQTVEQYETDSRTPLTIVPRGAHRIARGGA